MNRDNKKILIALTTGLVGIAVQGLGIIKNNERVMNTGTSIAVVAAVYAAGKGLKNPSTPNKNYRSRLDYQ